MRHDPPCHHCEERYLGCQGKCEKYIAFHEWRMQMLAEKRKHNQAIGDMIEIMRENWRKKRGHL